MTTLATSDRQAVQKTKVVYQGGASDSVYGLGFVGALVYYIGRARTFQEGVAGFFKAVVWPAILVYEILKLLNVEKPEPQETAE